MKTLGAVAGLLAARRARIDIGKLRLASDAGITPRTLGHVLSGRQDFKVSTLLAVADRLGLELMLVPREVAPAVVEEPAMPMVKTRVQLALDKIRKNHDER